MRVIKRDGKLQEFDKEKIRRCLELANSELEEEDRVEGSSLTKLVNAILGKIAELTVVDISNDQIRDISVEEIQDIVENELIRLNKYKLAKHYIKYRYQHQKVRDTEDTLLNYKKVVNGYLKVDDWRVKENSTVSYSLGGLILSNSGAVTANYWLSEVYDDEIANAHRNADIHIHDLSMLSGYCFTGDTRVKTLDGKNPTFRELVENNVKDLWVFSYDTSGKKIVPAKAINPRVTRKTRELVEITLCTGEKILSTPDHLFMTRDGNYVAAKNLRANSSLMPLYIGEKSEYVSINKAWSNQNGKMYLHRWIAEQVIGRPLGDNEVVHHINGDKHDNRPENLVVVNDTDHRRFEVLKTMTTDTWKSANRERLVEYNQSLEKRSSSSEFAKERERDSQGRFVSIFAYNQRTDKAGAFCNHRVRKVKRIMLDDEVEMYDLTVPGFENFALDTGIFVHNCAGWSLKQLIQEGLGGVPGKIASKPASHLHTLCNQMVNFLGIMQNEWAGAQAFSSFDTYLAPFVKVDNLSYKEVKQCIQSFVFGVNTPSRWGCQAPFTNVTIDWTVPSDLAELNAIVGGKEMDFRYKDCQKEMDMVNKAFLEVMIEGDANGRGFQYPIPTYSITRDFDWSETENNKLLFEMTAKYGIPYFSNYINSDMEPSDVRSMCPLTPDTLVTVRSEQNGIRVDTIHNIYQTYKNHGTLYDVWTGNGWCKGRPIQTPKTDVYKITFSNGYSVNMGANHLQPTKDFGTLHADELKVGMWLPFSKNKYGTDLGTYNLGYVVGAYVGDGSHDGASIVYSLDAKQKDDDTEEKIVKTWRSIGFNTKTTVGKNGSVRFVRVNGNPYDIVNKYVFGDNALTKGFTNKTFNASVEFKTGLLDGLMATDGSRDKKRISTSSPILRDHINILLSSIGMKCTQTFDDSRDGRFGDNVNYTIGVPCRNKYGDYFDEDDNYFYYSIKSIEKYDYKGEFLYCFEIDNDDHLFALSNGLITHNCRLRLDLRELRKKSGGFFGSGESTGSVGVVTINMPRIAYLSKSEDEFYKRLDHMMDISARSLKTKRTVIEKLLEAGLYPYTKRYLGTFNNHFSTIGLVGMNEACLNACWLKKDLTNIESQKFTIDVLNHMREKLSDYQEQYGDLYNLEATPAESTSYRLAKHDVEKYPNIITASMASGVPYYTNSSHLPVGYTDDIFSALDIQDELQTLYTSGTVFHAFLGEKLPSWQSAANLVRKIAENYRLPYFTMSPTYSVCKDHGYLVGEQYTCPYCGKPTEVYSRITGYYRPVQNWNDGKAQEFKDRKTYNLFNSYIDHASKLPTCDSCSIEEPVKENGGDIILVATPTCPNCKIACSLLDKKSISYSKLYANENKDIVEKYNIKQAPTLVVNGTKYVGVSEIKRYLESV